MKQMHCPSTQTGVGLLEVLVAALIFSVGILGVAAMQMNGMKVTKSAHNLSVATFIAEDMADRMRANLEGVQATDYDGICVCNDGTTENYCAGTCDTTNCTDPSSITTRTCYGSEANCDIPDADTASWKVLMCDMAPPGTLARITCPAPCNELDSPRTINVTWSEKEAIENAGNAIENTRNVTLIIHPITPLR